MCPEVEKRLKLEKWRSVNISRRTLLRSSALLSLSSLLPLGRAYSLPFSNVFDWDCMTCSISFCICVKSDPFPRIYPSIHNTFWYPAGFLEVNKKCTFLVSKIPLVGEALGGLLTTVCKALPKVWVQGTDLSVNWGTSDTFQQYMRVHARFYRLPKPLEPIVQTIITTLKLCPCPSTEFLEPDLEEATKALEKFPKILKKVGKTLPSSIRDNIQSSIGQVRAVIQNMLPAVQQMLPVFFTELLSPIWLIDVLSPDSALAKSIGSVILRGLAGTGPVTKAVICETLARDLPSKIGLDFAVDPTFFCVGLWGYGYPRIGVVRNDNPVVARLLALARFHHLFSKTIPVFPEEYEFSYEKVRYQLVIPYFEKCKKPGCGGLELPLPCDISVDPLKIVENIKDYGGSFATKGISLATDIPRHLLVVLWVRLSKCCC